MVVVVVVAAAAPSGFQLAGKRSTMEINLVKPTHEDFLNKVTQQNTHDAQNDDQHEQQMVTWLYAGVQYVHAKEPHNHLSQNFFTAW